MHKRVARLFFKRRIVKRRMYRPILAVYITLDLTKTVMLETTLDRNSAEHAAEIMAAVCPSKHEQQFILQQLLGSISIAEQYAPNSWVVTLFGNGFRLNVGPVEVFTFFRGEVRLFLLGSAPVEAAQYGEVFPTDFHSVPQPQHCFIGSTSTFGSVASVLQSVHAEFVHAAAITSKGNPRKGSSFARSHSPGLVTYAKDIVSETQLFSVAPQPQAAHLFEGAMRQVSTNVYERNPDARSQCIEAHGLSCVVCGFNFQSAYGVVAAGFIHVHHITPLSAMGQSYEVNPTTDLVPLCPNCHSVVHLASPPYSIEQVKSMFAVSQAQQGAPADLPASASLRQDGG